MLVHFVGQVEIRGRTPLKVCDRQTGFLHKTLKVIAVQRKPHAGSGDLDRGPSQLFLKQSMGAKVVSLRSVGATTSAVCLKVGNRPRLSFSKLQAYYSLALDHHHQASSWLTLPRDNIAGTVIFQADVAR